MLPPTQLHLECRAGLELGISYRRACRWEDALATYDEALKAASELGALEQTAMFSRICNNRAVVYRQSGRWHEALSALRDGLEAKGPLALQDSLNPNNLAINLRNTGHVLVLLGRYEEAEEYLRKALCIRRHVEAVVGEADCLSVLGLLYCDIGRYEEAEPALRSSLTLYEEAERWGSGWTVAACRLADLLLKCGRNKEACEWLDEAEAALAGAERDDLSSNCYAIRARALVVSDAQLAHNWAARAVTLAEDTDYLPGLGLGLLERGRAALALGRHQAAVADTERTLAIAERLPSPMLQARALIELGAIAKEQGQRKEARDYSQEAARVLQDLSVPEREHVEVLIGGCADTNGA